MSSLPTGWALAPISAVGELRLGKMLDKAKNKGELAKYLRNVNVRWFDFDLSDLQDIRVDDKERTALSIRDGDLMICEGGEPGRCAVWTGGSSSLVYQKALHRFRSNGLVDARFLMFQLKHLAASGVLQESFTGTTIKHLTRESLLKVEVLVPPLPEQMRIAGKLDRLIAAIDTCKARLNAIPAILKLFRQSVLAAATSGELTEEWRGMPAESGQLPSTWSESTIGEVGKVQLGRQRSPKFHSGDNMRPYLRVQNVFENRLDLTDVMAMHFSDADFDRYRLEHGDILLNEGQSPEYLGRPAMYRGEIAGACFTNTLIRFKAADRVRPAFALLVFRHHMHSGRYVAEGTITTNIAHLGAGRFANVEFPLPSLDEQDEIVRRADSLLSLADEAGRKLECARLAVDQLTLSILAKAFSGHLVPQDPHDEPANQLLERIKEKNEPASNSISGRTTIRVPRPRASITIKGPRPTIRGERHMLKRSAVSDSHLSALLTKMGSMSPEVLLRESRLDIDDFYDQLKDEEDRGLLREIRSGANKETSVLEVVL